MRGRCGRGASQNTDAGSQAWLPARRRLARMPNSRPGSSTQLYQMASRSPLGTLADRRIVVVRAEQRTVGAGRYVHVADRPAEERCLVRDGRFRCAAFARYGLQYVDAVQLHRRLASRSRRHRVVGAHHPEPDQPVAFIRQRRRTVGRPEVVGLRRVAAAARDPEVALGGAGGVARVALEVRAVPVHAPLLHVAVHVEQAPGIGLGAADVQRDDVFSPVVRHRSGNQVRRWFLAAPVGSSSPLENGVDEPARHAYSHSASVGRRNSAPSRSDSQRQ